MLCPLSPVKDPLLPSPPPPLTDASRWVVRLGALGAREKRHPRLIARRGARLKTLFVIGDLPPAQTNHNWYQTTARFIIGASSHEDIRTVPVYLMAVKVIRMLCTRNGLRRNGVVACLEQFIRARVY